MSGYEFIDGKGTFVLEQPENTSYLYFPIAGEEGLKGAVTPNLGGDLKTDQNHFVLQPVSAEELHNNKSTRNFWLCMEQGGSWSVTGASAQAQAEKFTAMQEESSLKAGLMWQELRRSSQKHQLEAKVTSFIPAKGQNVEVMQVEITNAGRMAATFTPVAAIPLYGRSADNIRDHRHVTSLLHRITTTDYGVEVTPTLSFDERGHQKNDTTYYVCGITGKGEAPESFYPVVEDFIGEGGSFERPEAVAKQLPGVEKGTTAEGLEALGGIRFSKTTLQPEEKVSYTVLIGLTRDRTEIEKTVEAFQTAEQTAKILEETKQYWLSSNNVSYHTGDEIFDNFMYWVNFQPMLRRIYGCSFLPHHDYGKGGRGWRDLWQDCLALLVMEPDNVREMLLNNFAGVRMDGSNATIIGNKPGEFIADRNNITRVWMDHGFWPFLTTKLYIDQTGDWQILLEKQNYFKDKQVCRGTGTDEKWKPEDGTLQRDSENRVAEGTILEHLLLQNLTAFYETGEHNHFRLRGADWNDALDMAEEQGESVAFTAAYSGNLKALAELLRYLDKNGVENITLAEEITLLLQQEPSIYNASKEKNRILQRYMASCIHEISGRKTEISCRKAADTLDTMAEWIWEHIRKTEWVGDNNGRHWFNSYYDNHGNKVEGIQDGSVRMMLTGQVFAIMSGTATEEQTAEITKAADAYLYKKEAGGYRLNTDFGELKTDLGRMFGFAYGQKENGAVFSHMTVMYGNALYQRGFVREGYKALHTLYEQSADFERSRIYPGIPEYFNAKGRGMYHYLTGAASWLMLTVVRQMFGIRGDLGSLLLAPKLLASQFDAMGRAEITLTFAGRTFHIVYENLSGKDYGEYHIDQVLLNGAAQETLIKREHILSLPEEKVHEIKVILK